MSKATDVLDVLYEVSDHALPFDDSLIEVCERHDHVRLPDEVKPGFWKSGEQVDGAAAFLDKRRPDSVSWR